MSEILLTLGEIARLIEGRVSDADAEVRITGIASIPEARSGDLTFLSIPKYLSALRNSQASAAIVPEGFRHELSMPVIEAANPSEAFGIVVRRFAPEPVRFEPGVHPSAVVSPEAEIGEGASIQPMAVVEAGARIGARSVIGAGTYVGHETTIGEDCLFWQRVVVRERCQIGNRVILHPGVVIGGDGFGYQFQNGAHVKIPQTGVVQIDDDVEIGSNSTIDRARFGRTWIQRGAKIDNLVMVAHNVIVGEGAILCGQVGISGSSRIGKFVTLAGQVGIAGHVEIGDAAVVGAQSGIAKSMPGGKRYFGSPAMDGMRYKRAYAAFHKLGNLVRQTKELEARLSELEER